MKLIQIQGVTYVKKWFRLYYVVESNGVLVMLPVRKVRLK